MYTKRTVEIAEISAKKAKEKCHVREVRLADERQPSWVGRPKRRRPGILGTKSTLLGGKFKFKFKEILNCEVHAAGLSAGVLAGTNRQFKVRVGESIRRRT